jgi:probable rRNA maturation factor
MSVEVANESGVEVDEASLSSIARHTLERLGVNPLAELSVIVVDTGTMSALHERWMGEPGPTDVLAFPMDELDTSRGPDDEEPGPTLLGDVVLCPEYARRGARAAGHSLADELHLLGYDHAEPEEEREMFALQTELLESWRGSARAR